MAEFVDVIYQTKRICKSVNGNCGKCLMGAFFCPNNARFDSTDEQEFIDFANAVMSWAAEHPEPVYPTWFEVLERFGVAGRISGEAYYGSMDREIYLKQPAFTPKAFEPISADIAEKLGIEPKEG